MWLHLSFLISFHNITQILIKRPAEIDVTVLFCGAATLIFGILFLVMMKALSNWWWIKTTKIHRDKFNRSFKNTAPKQ